MNNRESALQGKTIVVGVSGGIAAYKSCDLVSRLKKAGARVYVIMTKNACQFVQPLTMQTLSLNPVATDTFAAPQTWEVEHIALAQKADLFIVAPATASIIAKLAIGLADDMLSTTLLATRAPVLIAPAMNTQMYLAEPTQQNLITLQARGVHVVGPSGGLLACGDIGTGRMSEPQEIVEAAASILQPRGDFAGIHAIVTAGPTREAIDPVRFLTNRSSGKMGYALAEALRDRGAVVTLISGPVALPAPTGVELVPITSTGDLQHALEARVAKVQVLIQAAAPADYTAAQYEEQKIKKQLGEQLTLHLKQTTDVAALLGKTKQKNQIFVGFAAETQNGLENARRKLQSKNLDMICLNDVSQPDAGFVVDTNRITMVTPKVVKPLPLLSKQQVAHRILDEILHLQQDKV